MAVAARRGLRTKKATVAVRAGSPLNLSECIDVQLALESQASYRNAV